MKAASRDASRSALRITSRVSLPAGLRPRCPCGQRGERLSERRVQEGGVAAAAPRPLATRGRQSAPGLLPTLTHGAWRVVPQLGEGWEAAVAHDRFRGVCRGSEPLRASEDSSLVAPATSSSMSATCNAAAVAINRRAWRRDVVHRRRRLQNRHRRDVSQDAATPAEGSYYGLLALSSWRRAPWRLLLPPCEPTAERKEASADGDPSPCRHLLPQSSLFPKSEEGEAAAFRRHSKSAAASTVPLPLQIEMRENGKTCALGLSLVAPATSSFMSATCKAAAAAISVRGWRAGSPPSRIAHRFEGELVSGELGLPLPLR